MEILFVLGAVVVIALIYLAYKYAQKKAQERQMAMYAIAERHGLSFHPGRNRAPDPMLLGQASDAALSADQFIHAYTGLDPIGKGHSQEWGNIMFGSCSNHPALVFDYTYKVTTSDGKTTTTTTYYLQIIARTVPCLLPRFSMQKENFLLRVGEKLGYREIEFESEEFNKQWFVRGEDAKAIYDLLHPRAMERMLNVEPFRWEFVNNQILIIVPRWLDPAEIERALTDTDDFIALIPSYFLADRRA